MKIFLLILLLPLFVTAQTAPDKPLPKGVSKKLAKKVFRYLGERAAAGDAGDSVACRELSEFYDQDLLRHFDYSWNWLYSLETGIAWLYKGVKAGSAECGFRLGQEFSNKLQYSTNKQRDKDSAMYYYQFAADKGHVRGMISLAEKYDRRDIHAIYWFRQAAAKGSSEAAQEVADIITGLDDPFTKGYAAYKNNDMDLAMKLWKIDYKVNKNANAAFNVGILYQLKGRDMTDNWAWGWFDNACELGMEEGCMMSAKIFTEEGRWSMAVERWTKAAKLGNTKAAEYIKQTNASLAAQQAEHDAYWAEYTKRVNAAINNGTYVNPYAISSNSKANPTINYYQVPKKTAAENDQIMYDKMHQEQALREKAYREKWGN